MDKNMLLSSPLFPLQISTSLNFRGRWVLMLVLVFAVSCNKEKRFSKKLIKGETWKVESVMVDGAYIQGGSSTWNVSGDDIYETVSEVNWVLSGNNKTTFQWQFHNKGKNWILNNLCDCEEADGSLVDEADYLANDLAGTYEVIKHKRKEMLFRSSETRTYTGKVVEIHLIRE